jgi:hypothetical protein
MYRILLSIMMLALLAACQTNGSEEGLELENQVISSVVDGIRLELEKGEFVTSQLQGMTAEIINTTDYEYMYGTYFTIEQKRDGNWQQVPFKKNIGFDDRGIILKPNDSNEETIPLNLLERELTPGEYRLVKTLIPSNKPYSEKTTVIVAAPFEVTDP